MFDTFGKTKRGFVQYPYTSPKIFALAQKEPFVSCILLPSIKKKRSA